MEYWISFFQSLFHLTSWHLWIFNAISKLITARLSPVDAMAASEDWGKNCIISGEGMPAQADCAGKPAQVYLKVSGGL